MAYDSHDTIVAISSAPGGAARGIIRLSGPQTIACVAECFTPSDRDWHLAAASTAIAVRGTVATGAEGRQLPCDLFLWPTDRSYTRQPTAEFHTIGSPPLLDAVVEQLCRHGVRWGQHGVQLGRHGVRLAEPGEFTLRAFLAGRLDLTQAEAVLGVIDAGDRQQLDAALMQLAGGLSQPLTALRECLLQLTAELEAGLDFVEEDIEFISRERLTDGLAEAQRVVANALAQMSSRGDSNFVPRVALIGPPNAGKSSLFNALVNSGSAEETVKETSQQAIVSKHAGTTRDYLTAKVDLGGFACELTDTAGDDPSVAAGSLEEAAQTMTDRQRREAELRVYCVDATTLSKDSLSELAKANAEILVVTKIDLVEGRSVGPEHRIACSIVSGVGLDSLRQKIREQLVSDHSIERNTVAATAARCGESLDLTSAALSRAQQLVDDRGGEELIAAEAREALEHLGRVVGAVTTDDILDRIFGQFCIGK